jgi:hypothetical protein
MTLNVERVVDGGVNGQKSLSRSGRFEPLHAPLPLPDRKKNLSKPIAKLVADDLQKDLTKVPDHDLTEHLVPAR